jgi:hypothetical protein
MIREGASSTTQGGSKRSRSITLASGEDHCSGVRGIVDRSATTIAIIEQDRYCNHAASLERSLPIAALTTVDPASDQPRSLQHSRRVTAILAIDRDRGTPGSLLG